MILSVHVDGRSVQGEKNVTKMDLLWLKETVSSNEAPAAVGPYSQAVATGPLVFVSMQLGLVPGKKELAGPDIESQTRQAMENIAAVLEAAGSSLDLVVRSTVYLTDISAFQAFNETYSQFFPENPPARAALQVAALPLKALVGIEVMAIRD